MLVAADASAIANFAVAAGTAALAIGTFVLARSARAQAQDTKRLAAAAERQVAWMAHQAAATTMPRLRIKTSEGFEPVVEVANGRLKAVYINYGSVPAQVLEVGPEDNGGFAEADPVPPGEETVINMPTPSDWDGPDLRIYVRYRALHGGPELNLYTDLLQWSGGDWGLLSEYEREQD